MPISDLDMGRYGQIWVDGWVMGKAKRTTVDVNRMLCVVGDMGGCSV